MIQLTDTEWTAVKLKLATLELPWRECPLSIPYPFTRLHPILFTLEPEKEIDGYRTLWFKKVFNEKNICTGWRPSENYMIVED